MTNTQESELDIIIVTWKTREMTCSCVESVLKLSSAEGIKSIVWVVDNNSCDGTIEALHEHFPNANVIESSYNSGFSIANNMAIRQSANPFILLLNSDAFLKPGCLSALLATIKQDTLIGAVGPKLLLKSGDVQHSVTQITSPLSQFGYLLAFYFPPFDRVLRPIFSRNRHALISGNETREVPLLSAACLLLRREVFDRVGLLPEDRFLYSEEDDLFFRMRKNGIKSMFVPSSEALHLCGESTKKTESSPKSTNYFIQSRLRFLFKHYPKSRFITFATHWVFFIWCVYFSRMKYVLRRGGNDQQYIADSRMLVGIAKEEYAKCK